MVKADLTRDYYGDLEISATATETEIKKQFRLLALKYHPDRNPGRESEVQSKFQTIQSAVEVLTDAEQRAKYDSGRARVSRGGMGGSAFASQARPASGFARGNPYANAGAGFPPPPSRRDARPKPQAPPPSAGASRYASNFGARPGGYAGPPRPPPAHDDAESRRKTYEAWNRMRGDGRQYEQTAYERTRPPPPPPPQPQPQRGAPPPVPKRSGYAPNSMHDEPPAANTSAYSTSRHRAPTAKQEAYSEPPPRKQAPADPFKTFREQSGTPLEPRLSTPYAGRGSGEKTNPFESVNIGRSNTTRADSSSFGKSTRERHRSVSPNTTTRRPNIVPDFNEQNRAGSDTNINGSPKRTFSKTSGPSNLGSQPRTNPVIDLTSSDDSGEEQEKVQRKYAKVKTRRNLDTSTPANSTTAPDPSHQTPNPAAQGTSGTPNGDPKMYDTLKSTTRLHYLRTRASDWSKPNPARTMPAIGPNGALLDNASALNTPSGDSGGRLKWKGKLPTVLDFSSLASPISPDAFSSSPSALTPFESFQGNILDKLVEKNSPASRKSSLKKVPRENRHSSQELQESQDPSSFLLAKPPWIDKLDPSDIILLTNPDYVIRMLSASAAARENGNDYPLQNFANWPALLKFLTELAADMPTFRFSFNVDGQTYTAHSNPSKFSGAFTPQGTEKINTTFTPEDWHRKFEAGDDYFTGNPPTPSRASSSSSGAKRAAPKTPGSSSTNPYPIIDNDIPKQEKSDEAPQSQPTKFTPDEWAETFKPQVFAAPPTPAPPRGYSRSGTTRRQKTAAASGKSTKPRTAAVESDDDSDPLYMGSRPVSKNGKKGAFTEGDLAASPNAMDIDPPTSTGGVRNVNVEPSRPEWRTGQPAGLGGFTTPDESPTRSGPPPPPLPPLQPQFDGQMEEGDLKTNFEDFKNTEPFMTPAKGLSSFADLKTELPFESKASSAVPFPKGFNSKDLIIPPPPKGPKPPTDGARPSPEAFQAYVQKMIAYLSEWTKYDAKMVGHFQARNESVKMVCQQKPDWISTIGDGHLDEYMENVDQDERVREWWANAVDKHRDTMKEFKWVKKIYRDGPQEARKESGLFGEVVDGARA